MSFRLVIAIIILTTGISSCSSRSACNGFPSTKSSKPLTKRQKRKMERKSSKKGLFSTDVAFKYGLHKYDKKTSEKKAQRMLKKELKKGK